MFKALLCEMPMPPLFLRRETRLTARPAAQLWRVPRYALKTAGVAAAPLLGTLAQALPAWFERSLQAAVLYMAAEVVKIFGRDATQHAVLGELLNPQTC